MRRWHSLISSINGVVSWQVYGFDCSSIGIKASIGVHRRHSNINMNLPLPILFQLLAFCIIICCPNENVYAAKEDCITGSGRFNHRRPFGFSSNSRITKPNIIFIMADDLGKFIIVFLDIYLSVCIYRFYYYVFHLYVLRCSITGFSTFSRKNSD